MANNNDSSTLFFNLTASGITLQSSELLRAALSYTKEHTSPTTVNHCMRSAAYALLFAGKLPHLASVDRDLIVFSCIFHDMGWAHTKSLISDDKRFEVDGANIARAWVRDHLTRSLGWNERQVQLCWDAIALHTTPSIAQHKELEVAAVNMGITADFLGPNFPGGLITTDEHKDIVQAFPRLGFQDEVIHVMCGLCKNKPQTTYDNFVAEFGVKYGLDGKGSEKEKFAQEFEQNKPIHRLMGALTACEEYEK